MRALQNRIIWQHSALYPFVFLLQEGMAERELWLIATAWHYNKMSLLAQEKVKINPRIWHTERVLLEQDHKAEKGKLDNCKEGVVDR